MITLWTTKNANIVVQCVMSYRTVEVEIDHGKITLKEPESLPQTGTGLLTIFPSPLKGRMSGRARADFPIIHCKPGTRITPSPEELDASLWD